MELCLRSAKGLHGIMLNEAQEQLYCCLSIGVPIFSHGPTVLVGLGLLNEFHRSHSDTPHSVELLRTSDRPVAETSV